MPSPACFDVGSFPIDIKIGVAVDALVQQRRDKAAGRKAAVRFFFWGAQQDCSISGDPLNRNMLAYALVM
jgi:hypothetical protein